MVPNLNQINQVTSYHSAYLRSYLILAFHLCQCFPSCLLPTGFLTKILYECVFSPMNVIFPTHLVFSRQMIVQEKHLKTKVELPEFPAEELCYQMSSNVTLISTVLKEKFKTYLNFDIWFPDSEVILCIVFITGIMHSCHAGDIEGTLVHQSFAVFFI